MAATSDGRESVLAQRLSHLFKTVHPKGRGPYTQREAADLINEAAGEDVISYQYLGSLCTGRRDDPSARKLLAIAKFFHVDVTYFTDDEQARLTDEDLELLRLMRDQGVKAIATRSEGLSPERVREVLQLIEASRIADGLPPAGASGDEL